MTDLTALSIEDAARGMDRGTFDAVDLLEAHLARIGRIEPELNCFIALTAELARAEAEASVERARAKQRRGPLDGIPLALKDNIDLAGVPTTNGLGRAAAATPDVDAAVVGCLKAAGAVVLGKLNLHEGALGATTDNPHHGRTQNPWRHGFTPGGSSGGSASAVAARLCMASLGTDTMGSVRLPAAYCGIVGFKPSAGLVNRQGLQLLCGALDEIGPLTRSVGDAALVLQAMLGGETALPRPPELRGLRIGVIENFSEVELEPEVGSALQRALSMLEAEGVTLRQLSLADYAPSPARRAGLLLSEAEGWRRHAGGIEATPVAYSPGFTAMLAYGRDAGPERLARAEATVRQVGTHFADLLWQVDAVVSPTAPQTAFAFEAPVPVNQADLTAPASFAGAPAVSLPLALSGEGLPIGLQIIAAPSADARLLAIAAAVEALLPSLGPPNDR